MTDIPKDRIKKTEKFSKCTLTIDMIKRLNATVRQERCRSRRTAKLKYLEALVAEYRDVFRGYAEKTPPPSE